MVLKTYRGTDLPAALRQVRRELGPDALVLGTSESKGRFGVKAVEVTVACARHGDETGAPATGEPTTKDLAREIRELRTMLQRDRPGARTTPAPRARAVAFCHRAVELLIASGMDPDLAARFGRISAQGNSPGSIAAGVTLELDSILNFVPLPLDKRCLFVVGPPGSGKTTTVAKLASRVCAPDRPVVFGVSDGERIAGFEQAEIYSRYIGTQARRLRNVADLRSALETTGDAGIVLVDTSGIGTTDTERLEHVRTLRESVPSAEVAVLLPAGLHHAEATRILDRMEVLQPTCVGLSRVDDSNRPGELLTALHGRRTPLAFLTTGHRVPDALEPASPQNVASLLVEGRWSQT